MIKALKLRKAVVAIILGIIGFVIAEIMSRRRTPGASTVLVVSGILLIIGALLFLYPILFAKKIEGDGEIVELKPLAKQPIEDDL